MAVLAAEIDEIKRWQQQRLESALNSWDESKKLLEQAIARVEAREKEYNAIAGDVHRKMEALDMVAVMRQEVDAETAPEQPAVIFPAIVTRSRPLFGMPLRSMPKVAKA